MLFRGSKFLTLGVELELQLVDWRTQDLCPAAARVLSQVGGNNPHIKPEIFQSMLEICTGVCHSLAEVERDLRQAQSAVLTACQTVGVEVVGAATHPFATLEDNLVYPAERYRHLIDRNQWIARRLAIFGLHVHIGVEDGAQATDVSNGLLPYLAYLLALSASSPFMHGHDTGLESSRSTVFESQPTAGTPRAFASWQEFSDRVALLTRAGAIASLKDLWWDLRPNPEFGTVEVRICDGGARLSDTLAVVAVLQALVFYIQEQRRQGMVPAIASQWRLRENKWRAARWGLEADVVVDEQGTVSPLRIELNRLLDRLQPYAAQLDSLVHFARARELVAEGTSSTRQREVFSQTRSVNAVVQALVREWRDDIDVRVF